MVLSPRHNVSKQLDEESHTPLLNGQITKWSYDVMVYSAASTEDP